MRKGYASALGQRRFEARDAVSGVAPPPQAARFSPAQSSSGPAPHHFGWARKPDSIAKEGPTGFPFMVAFCACGGQASRGTLGSNRRRARRRASDAVRSQGELS